MTHSGQTPLSLQPQDVVAFWRDAGPQAWFTKDAAFDERFRQRCGVAHLARRPGSWMPGWMSLTARWR